MRSRLTVTLGVMLIVGVLGLGYGIAALGFWAYLIHQYVT